MKLFAWICAGVMLFNMIAICCDVFRRYVMNNPIQGVTETCAMLMAWVAYAGLAYGLMTGQHMQLGALYDKLSGRKGHVVSFIIYLLSFLLYCVLTYASAKVFYASFIIMEKAVAAVTVYIWIGKLGVVVGWVLLGIESLFMLIYCIQGIVHPEMPMILRKSELPTEEELGELTSGDDPKDVP